MKHAKILSRLLSVVLCAAILAGCGTAQSGGSADARTATGTAAGFGGQVSVTLTMDAEGNLTDVAVTGDGETPDVGGKAIPTLQAAMKASRGTFSSKRQSPYAVPLSGRVNPSREGTSNSRLSS